MCFVVVAVVVVVVVCSFFQFLPDVTTSDVKTYGSTSISESISTMLLAVT